jgi:hypothetical protein
VRVGSQRYAKDATEGYARSHTSSFLSTLCATRAVAAALVAVVVPGPPAIGAEPLAGAKETRAEVQIGLCAPTDQIEPHSDCAPAAPRSMSGYSMTLR